MVSMSLPHSSDEAGCLLLLLHRKHRKTDEGGNLCTSKRIRVLMAFPCGNNFSVSPNELERAVAVGES
jgi:hypothetical protein